MEPKQILGALMLGAFILVLVIGYLRVRDFNWRETAIMVSICLTVVVWIVTSLLLMDGTL